LPLCDEASVVDFTPAIAYEFDSNRSFSL